MDINAVFQTKEKQIIAWRRWFHQHPEVALQEEQTSAYISQALADMGLKPERLAPGFGVAAVIEGARPGKTIALRADIDALPVAEETGLPFQSEVQGMMHACGHDGHVAMLLGVADVLAGMKDSLSGRVILVFQAAEEIGKGHEEVLQYLAKAGGVDAIIGLHIWSGLAEGEMLLLPGAVFAGNGRFHVTMTGEGGHGARPDLVRDPIKALCDFVLQSAAIPANYYDVLDPSVCTTCRIQAGSAHNIFPQTAEAWGTFRYFKAGGDESIKGHIDRMAQGVALIHGCEAIVRYEQHHPPVVNDADIIARARKLVGKVDNLSLSAQTEPISASDNMGHLLAAYPGFYGILGAGRAAGKSPPHHNPRFDIAEVALVKGASFMAAFALDFLSA